MEEGVNCSWNSSSNWIVARGAIENSVSFESSASPIEDDAVIGSGDLLVLNSPSADAGPCEITVTFGQNHEVRQVYVKSTARIYEIYYLPCNQSCNEYLCTVHCGVAEKEEKLLNVGDTSETSTHAECSEVTDKTENSSNASEEDYWVEVKNSECSSSCNSEKYTLEEVAHNFGGANQDFYEATAEITDARSCVSITLRLLSFNTKDCVHIDNIYIYADPAEVDESGPQFRSIDSSASASLLSMLVPSLLQLSKSEAHRTHERSTSETLKGNDIQGGINMTKPIHHEIRNTIQQEYNSKATGLQEGGALDSVVEPEEEGKVAYRKQILEPVSKEENMVSSGLEIVLNQLDSRVGRIEVFCSRFEETMLKLLDSTERRFQQLEQQLDTLAARNIQTSTFFVSSKFAAPEFSCEESETNSLQKDNNELSSRDPMKDLRSSLQDNSVDVKNLDASLQDNSVDVKNLDASLQDDDARSSLPLRPSLVITAPEFSNDDESDSGDELSELVEEDPPIKKPAVSIDDAIASALSALTVESGKSHKLNPPPNLETCGNTEFGLPSAADELKEREDPSIASPDMDDTRKPLESDDHQKDLNFESQENTRANCSEEVMPERRIEHVITDKLGTSMVTTEDDEAPCIGVESNLPSSETPDAETVQPTALPHETRDTQEKWELRSTGSQELDETCNICSPESHETGDAKKVDTLRSLTGVIECQNAEGQNGEATETGIDRGPASKLEPSLLDVNFVGGDGATSRLPLEALLYDTMPLPVVVTEVQTSGDEDEDASGVSCTFGLDAELLIETGRFDLENVPSENTGSSEPFPASYSDDGD